MPSQPAAGHSATTPRSATNAAATIVGVDHSPALIEVARQRTAQEGLDQQVEYVVGDAHHLTFTDEAFEVVVMHTLLSHVDDPLQVLREARRVCRRGGQLAIFDGDFASLSFGYPDVAIEQQIEATLLQLVIANPRVMRDLPRLLHEANDDDATTASLQRPRHGSGSTLRPSTANLWPPHDAHATDLPGGGGQCRP